MFTRLVIFTTLVLAGVLGAPQFPLASSRIPIAGTRIYSNDVPTPYEYQYKVENPSSNTYYGKSEAGDATGKVTGTYYVYLPDGRLMTVDYLVDGESGFLPKVTFVSQGYPGVGVPVPVRSG